MIEVLERRQLLSAAAAAGHIATGGHRSVSRPFVNLDVALSVADVTRLLGQAASQALPTQVVAVADREGEILGIFGGSGLSTLPSSVQTDIVANAIARARTVAFFESSGEAFTTRTARFIVQDHFPWPVRNTPGGPLYGVEFSSLINSDVLLPSQVPAITGDPGGIPLFIGAVPVGGIGVAGDFHDVAPRPDLTPPQPVPGTLNSSLSYAQQANPRDKHGNYVFFNGQEEHDYDEAVAMAGAVGYTAPPYLRADHIFVAGLRFPFNVDGPAHRAPTQTLSALVAAGDGSIMARPTPSATGSGVTAVANLGAGEAERDNASFAGDPGLLRQWSNINPATGQSFTDPEVSQPIRPATDSTTTGASALTVSDVSQIITNAVRQALNTRAGIRKPNGVNAEVHVVVVDTNGNVLAAFRMHDGTNFSYDVAVQKARTAMFFSSNTAAFSSRAIGFMSQAYFPAGIGGEHGPLYHLQNDLELGLPGTNNLIQLLSLNPAVGAHTPIRNGITIFPGGFPLYKNGVLVGGIGISGDGVDQDDIIGYAGTDGFRPAPAIQSDELSGAAVAQAIMAKVGELVAAAHAPFDTARAAAQLSAKHLRLPYTKFPRNPDH